MKVHALPLVCLLAVASWLHADDIPVDLGGTSKKWAHYQKNDYFKDRATKTVVLQNENISIGVSKDFGGAIFEFFGKNRYWDHDLIQMSDGGGLQLSIWGKDATADPKLKWFGAATPNLAGTTSPDGLQDLKGYATKEACAAAGNMNPKRHEQRRGGVQTGRQHRLHAAGEPLAVHETSRCDGIIFEEWVTLHDAFVEIRYAVSSRQATPWTRAPQEMPAICSGNTMNDHGFFYQGVRPFTKDVAVERMGHEQRRLKYPSPVENDGKYMREQDKYKGNIREGWWSVCNASEDMCLTVACFSGLVESVDFNLNKTDGHGYLTPQSCFAVNPARTLTWTIYLFPDKYDGVIAGKPVRDWVYELAPADFKARAEAE